VIFANFLINVESSDSIGGFLSPFQLTLYWNWYWYWYWSWFL